MNAHKSEIFIKTPCGDLDRLLCRAFNDDDLRSQTDPGAEMTDARYLERDGTYRCFITGTPSAKQTAFVEHCNSNGGFNPHKFDI